MKESPIKNSNVRKTSKMLRSDSQLSKRTKSDSAMGLYECKHTKDSDVTVRPTDVFCQCE